MNIRNLQIKIMEMIIMGKSNAVIILGISILKNIGDPYKYIDFGRRGFIEGSKELRYSDLDGVIKHKGNLENDMRRR